MRRSDESFSTYNYYAHFATMYFLTTEGKSRNTRGRKDDPRAGFLSHVLFFFPVLFFFFSSLQRSIPSRPRDSKVTQKFGGEI